MADVPHQFQMAYVAEQDRMLLRINTHDKAEFRLWLTRRMIASLWDVLLKAVASGATPAAPLEAGRREAILQFDHQAAVEQADFATSFREEAGCFPLGEEGVLVTTIGIARKAAGGYTLKLSPRRGNGISINLDDKLLHSFMQLLIDSARHAQWGLELKLPAGESGASADVSAGDKVLRH